MNYFKSIPAVFIFFLAILQSSCNVNRRMILRGFNKKIILFDTIPSDAIGFRYDEYISEQRITFYFDRTEWNNLVKKDCPDENKRAKYFSDLNDAKDSSGIYFTSHIPCYPYDTTRISCNSETDDLINKLVRLGHVCMIRKDGTAVKKLICKVYVSYCDKMWEYYDDKTKEPHHTAYKQRHTYHCGGDF